MNWGKASTLTVLAASVMILVTFAPQQIVAPLQMFLSQVRMNNVSASSNQSGPTTPSQDGSGSSLVSGVAPVEK